jgi:hypothetical protein
VPQELLAFAKGQLIVKAAAQHTGQVVVADSFASRLKILGKSVAFVDALRINIGNQGGQTVPVS